MNKYKVAVVGATGVVGRTILKVLEEKNLPVSEYCLFASKNSAGNKLKFNNKEYIVQELTENSFDSGFDFAIFSAGGDIAKKFAPIAVERGCVVVDNSSAFRMDKDVPLVVPEVNKDELKNHKGIIANPNCSTIQAVLVLAPLNEAYKIKRIVYSTYQAVSGAGKKGILDLENGIKQYYSNTDGNNEYELQKFPYPIFNNCLPHIDVFLDNGYTKEEEKMINETRKILGRSKLPITATAVRVPVFNCHGESINIEFNDIYEINDAIEVLKSAPGVVIKDDLEHIEYPLPTEVSGQNDVYVGRIRRDFSLKSGLNLWVVGDNIRKGAATNAVQIVEELMKM